MMTPFHFLIRSYFALKVLVSDIVTFFTFHFGFQNLLLLFVFNLDSGISFFYMLFFKLFVLLFVIFVMSFH